MATAEFLRQWRSKQGALSLLARLDLPRADGTQVDSLYVGISDQQTWPDSSTGDPGRFWLGAVREFAPVRIPGGFGSTDLPLATGGVTLYADRAIKFAAGVGAAISTTIRGSLSTHVWLNAKATIWRYFHSLNDFKHAQALLPNARVIEWALEDDALVLTLRQGTEWNKPLTPRTVGRHEFPRAPDAVVGAALPIAYGKLGYPGMRRPWASRYPSNFRQYAVLDSGFGVGGRHGKALLVDNGRGTGAAVNPNAKVLVAGHLIDSVLDDAKGTAVWFDVDGTLVLMYSPSTVVNGASGAGMTIPDGFSSAWIGVVPRDLVVAGALEARNILDPSDVSYALLDKAQPAFVNLAFSYQLVPTGVGIPLSAKWQSVVGYVSSSDLSGLNLYSRAGLDAENNPTSLIMNLPASTTPTIALSQEWDSPWNNPAYVYTQAVRFSGGAGTAKIFFVGMVYKVTILRVLLDTQRLVSVEDSPVPERRDRAAFGPFAVRKRLPSASELRGDFYANWWGTKDDGAGTYTGTPAAVVERAPDIIMEMLVRYGGVSLADIERGAATHGSFVGARGVLALPMKDPTHVVAIAEGSDLLTTITKITSDSLCQMFVSPYDGKFKLNAWKPGLAPSYSWKFSRYDLNEPLGPQAEQTPLPDIVTGIRVAYGYDEKGETYRSEVALTGDRSVAGHDYRGIRDQDMTVVAGKNDRFDFQSGGSIRLASLAPAIYVPQSSETPGSGLDTAKGFAQQLKVQIAWAEGTQATASRWQVGWGAMVTRDYNDRLAVRRSFGFPPVVNTFNNVKMAASGTEPYATMEVIAQAAQDALNAQAVVVLGQNWHVRYDRTTMKFYVSHDGGGWDIVNGSGYSDPIRLQSGWAALGFLQNGGAGGFRPVPTYPAELAADDIRLAHHFYLTSMHEGLGADLLFRSGANGADSAVSVRHCADLLGFASSEDKLAQYSSGGTGYTYCGDCPKDDRETIMRARADLYGPRRELNLEARTIQDTDTALALRDRAADLFGARTPLRLTTRMAPDIELGHVIEFGADLDGLAKYPGPGSDGSWIGKRMVVVEAAHSMGPTSLDTEIVAVDIGLLPSIAVAIGAGIMMGGILMGLA